MALRQRGVLPARLAALGSRTRGNHPLTWTTRARLADATRRRRSEARTRGSAGFRTACAPKLNRTGHAVHASLIELHLSYKESQLGGRTCSATDFERRVRRAPTPRLGGRARAVPESWHGAAQIWCQDSGTARAHARCPDPGHSLRGRELPGSRSLAGTPTLTLYSPTLTAQQAYCDAHFHLRHPDKFSRAPGISHPAGCDILRRERHPAWVPSFRASQLPPAAASVDLRRSGQYEALSGAPSHLGRAPCYPAPPHSCQRQIRISRAGSARPRRVRAGSRPRCECAARRSHLPPTSRSRRQVDAFRCLFESSCYRYGTDDALCGIKHLALARPVRPSVGAQARRRAALLRRAAAHLC